MRQVLPEMFRNERHERMEHFQGMRQDIDQDVLDRMLVSFAFGLVKAFLSQFDVPVAVGVPDEVVNGIGSVAEFKFIEVFRDFGDSFIEGREDPAVSQGQVFIFRNKGFVKIAEVHDDEFRSVPDFIGKIAVCFDAFHIKAHVIARRVARNQGEAQCVGTVLFADAQGIDAIA